MNSTQWPMIERIYYAVLDLADSERAAFLNDACLGDLETRQEVESLLAANLCAGEFLAGTALEMVAKSFAKGQIGTSSGDLIAHYEVLSLLGAGGMGEVYLARDTQLGRKLALKILPAAFTVDEDRVRRFEQEARAASALNHPNIITIYDIDADAGTDFIAMEYVAGQTLDQLIGPKYGPLRFASGYKRPPSLASQQPDSGFPDLPVRYSGSRRQSPNATARARQACWFRRTPPTAAVP